jgi:hypothetical protein
MRLRFDPARRARLDRQKRTAFYKQERLMATENKPRIWRAFASRGHQGRLINIYTWRQALQMSGVPDDEIVVVELVEDPDGVYAGWLRTDEEAARGKLQRHEITLVQSRQIFDVQFPYGAEAEVKAGKGQIVYLRVEQLAELPVKGEIVSTERVDENKNRIVLRIAERYGEDDDGLRVLYTIRNRGYLMEWFQQKARQVRNGDSS